MSIENETTDAPGDGDQIHLNTDLIGGIVIALFGLVGLLAAGEGAFNVWVFPKFNSIVILLMAVAMIIEGLVRRPSEAVINKTNAKRLVLPMSVGLVLFYVFFTRLGWIITTTMLFGLAMFTLRSKRDLKAAATSLLLAGVFALFFYYVFGNAFYVPWPEGTWVEPLLGG